MIEIDELYDSFETDITIFFIDRIMKEANDIKEYDEELLTKIQHVVNALNEKYYISDYVINLYHQEQLNFWIENNKLNRGDCLIEYFLSQNRNNIEIYMMLCYYTSVALNKSLSVCYRESNFEYVLMLLNSFKQIIILEEI